MLVYSGFFGLVVLVAVAAEQQSLNPWAALPFLLSPQSLNLDSGKLRASASPSLQQC